jgi:hypothetical protein
MWPRWPATAATSKTTAAAAWLVLTKVGKDERSARLRRHGQRRLRSEKLGKSHERIRSIAVFFFGEEIGGIKRRFCGERMRSISDVYF